MIEPITPVVSSVAGAQPLICVPVGAAPVSELAKFNALLLHDAPMSA